MARSSARSPHVATTRRAEPVAGRPPRDRWEAVGCAYLAGNGHGADEWLDLATLGRRRRYWAAACSNGAASQGDRGRRFISGKAGEVTMAETALTGAIVRV